MKHSKLAKLITHEKSARKIGSTAEADAFAAKISDIKAKAEQRRRQISKLLRQGVWRRRIKQTEEEIAKLQRRLEWLKGRLRQV